MAGAACGRIMAAGGAAGHGELTPGHRGDRNLINQKMHYMYNMSFLVTIFLCALLILSFMAIEGCKRTRHLARAHVARAPSPLTWSKLETLSPLTAPCNDSKSPAGHAGALSNSSCTHPLERVLTTRGVHSLIIY